jgi:hypothetical protein
MVGERLKLLEFSQVYVFLLVRLLNLSLLAEARRIHTLPVSLDLHIIEHERERLDRTAIFDYCTLVLRKIPYTIKVFVSKLSSCPRNLMTTTIFIDSVSVHHLCML